MASWHTLKRLAGFTLLEISIVLVILGVLANAFLQPIGSQVESAKRQETRDVLLRVEQAVMGFAAAHGRLPCPAPFDQTAIEVTDCTLASRYGTVPAVTLALPGKRNEHGALVDAWNQPLHYMVSASDHPQRGNPGRPDFTTSSEMGQVGMMHLAAEIQICAEPVSGDCPRRALLANQVPVVFFSSGKPAEHSALEAENLDGDAVFVHRDYSAVAGHRFDDLLHWIPENLLFYRMLQAGVLP